jgi:hypothetical protein
MRCEVTTIMEFRTGDPEPNERFDFRSRIDKKSGNGDPLRNKNTLELVGEVKLGCNVTTAGLRSFGTENCSIQNACNMHGTLASNRIPNRRNMRIDM